MPSASTTATVVMIGCRVTPPDPARARSRAWRFARGRAVAQRRVRARRAGGGIRSRRRFGEHPALAHARLPPRPADDAALDEAEHRGRERERDEHGDRDGDGGRDAHRREERDVGERQADERDEHRDAGEDDRRAGGAGGARGGLLGIDAGAHLVLMSGDDEQRVVDADREARA